MTEGVPDPGALEGVGVPLRLNLGAGEVRVPGFRAVDRKGGEEVYPLDAEDGSVAEIRASHVLEHFSHRQVPAVLADWVRALAPGGLLRVAVPDFQLIAEQYLAGAALPTEGYVMGGHVDADDHHGALFDEGTLTDLLAGAGLLGVSRWISEARDCASLPISLNLQGWKPPAEWPRVSAVMSVPRLGFCDNQQCAASALGRLGIPLRLVSGAFWGQCLTRGFERAIEEDDPEFLLAIDYDSLYSRRDVEALLSAALRHPEAHAIAALQAHRKDPRALFTVEADGKPVTHLDRAQFGSELTRVATAHFGLTLLRVDALRRCPRPWFVSQPDEGGQWGEGRIDDDVHFWRAWATAGLTAYVANRVPIGHLELLARWPDRDLGVTHQHPSDFHSHGKPEDVWR